MCVLCEIGSRHPSFHVFDSTGETGSSDPASSAHPSLSTAQAAGRLAEVAWSSPGTPITYAFRSTSTDAAFERFTSAQIQGAELALQQWSDVANIRFERMGSGTSGNSAYSNSATLLFSALSDDPSYAYAYLPGSRSASSLGATCS